MKPSKFGFICAMSSDEARINDALLRLEKSLEHQVGRCSNAEEVRNLMAHVIWASEHWCNQPRVDRAPWIERLRKSKG